MLDKTLKLVIVLAVLGVATGVVPQRALAANNVPGSRACPGASDGSPQVCGVEIQPAATGAATIAIATSREIPYHVMQLSSPRRLVVDFTGARNAASQRVFPAKSDLLARVRVGQWRTSPTSIVRVVADLEGSPHFAIHREAWGVRIELRSKGGHFTHPAPAPPNPFRFGSRGGRTSAEAGPGKARSPSAEFAVHQFADLTASLTPPQLPSQDHLVPLIKESPLAEADKHSGKIALVYGVSIRPDADGKTLVDIASSQPVPYRVFQLENPLRLVVDLKDARDAGERDLYAAQSPVLKRVRVGQWRGSDPAVVRIVADLEGSPMFDVHAQKPGVRIELSPRRALGKIIRNPFEFERAGPSIRISRPSDRTALSESAHSVAPPASVRSSLSGLKVLGYLEKPGSGIQAIVSDDVKIYFVPEGGAFEERFRLLQITNKAVQVEDMTTQETAWLQLTR